MLDAKSLIQMALAEDLGGRGDVTTAALIAPDAIATAHFVNRKRGVVAGLDIIGQVFAFLADVIPAKAGIHRGAGTMDSRLRGNDGLQVTYHVKDGDYVAAQTKLVTVTGPAAAILTAERTALNFVSHLSGIATATHTLQRMISHTKAKVCDTRKTTPGMRLLEKYAVTCGGGANHRMGLYDMVMIKDNHIAALGDIGAAIAKARAAEPTLPIAVEVEDLLQLREALASGADRIMLDNMSVEMMREAVSICHASESWHPVTGEADTKSQASLDPSFRWGDNLIMRCPALEATGGITAENIVAVAETGVDFISVGAITHSAPILDIGLDFE